MNEVIAHAPVALRPNSSRRHAPNVRPSPLRVTTVVSLHGELYVAELVERQGQEWVAGIVPLSMAFRPSAPMRFAPVSALEWDDDEPMITGRRAFA